MNGVGMIAASAALVVLIGRAFAGDEFRKGPPPGSQAGSDAGKQGGGAPATHDDAETPGDRGKEPGIDDFAEAEAWSFADSRAPDVKGEARERWDRMEPKERGKWMRGKVWLKRTPARKWEQMSAAERGAFLLAHPLLKQRLRARWEGLAPEQRGLFLRANPGIGRRIQRRAKMTGTERRGPGERDGEASRKGSAGRDGSRDRQ